MLLGSNLFNGLAIVGVASGIHPTTVPLQEIAITISADLLALLLLISSRSAVLGRAGGLVLLALWGLCIGKDHNQ